MTEPCRSLCRIDGFGHIEKQFFVNNWLLEEGFLVLKKTPFTFLKKILFDLGIVPMGILVKFLASLGIDLSKTLARNSERVFTGLNKWVLSFEDVDWKYSKAYAMGNMGFINVNLKGREPQGIVEQGVDYERVLDEISEKIVLFERSPNRRTPGRPYPKKQRNVLGTSGPSRS